MSSNDSSIQSSSRFLQSYFIICLGASQCEFRSVALIHKDLNQLGFYIRAELLRSGWVPNFKSSYDTVEFAKPGAKYGIGLSESGTLSICLPFNNHPLSLTVINYYFSEIYFLRWNFVESELTAFDFLTWIFKVIDNDDLLPIAEFVPLGDRPSLLEFLKECQ